MWKKFKKFLFHDIFKINILFRNIYIRLQKCVQKKCQYQNFSWQKNLFYIYFIFKIIIHITHEIHQFLWQHTKKTSYNFQSTFFIDILNEFVDKIKRLKNNEYELKRKKRKRKKLKRKNKRNKKSKKFYSLKIITILNFSNLTNLTITKKTKKTTNSNLMLILFFSTKNYIDKSRSNIKNYLKSKHV